MLMPMKDAEERVSLEHARVHIVPLRAGGKAVNQSTLVRWYLKGLRPDPTADPIRLEVEFVGNRVVTTAEAVQRFFAAVTAAKLSRIERNTPTDVSEPELVEAGLK